MVQGAKATWFVVSEENQPMGQLSVDAAEAAPNVGSDVTGLSGGKKGTVIEFSELSPTCGSRRYRVIVKVLD